jgi:phytoene dehydrogenase-like protein
MANCPATSDWTDADTAAARRNVFARLQASGFPDISNDIVVESIWSPREFARIYAMPGGAIYGQASHGWRGAFLRPAIRDRHTKGLYRVGGSSHPGGGTPTVLMGARIATELINKYECT